jgi:ribonuclease G
MSKELVISATSHERRVAILEEGQLVEIYIEREKEFALVGSIYKGRVTRVLPGMQSAFVDIGLDGDAFLYVSDVFENLEDYDHGHGHEPTPAVTHGEPPTSPEHIELPGEMLAHAHEAPATESVSEESHGESQQHDVHTHVEESEPGAPGVDETQHTSEEERQPDSNESAPQNFAPRYNPTQYRPSPSFSPRAAGDRGGSDRGGDRQNLGRSGGRGRFGRGGGSRGRTGRSSGGGFRPSGGRDLPPSKYASPQGGESRGDRGPDRGGDRGGRGGYSQRGGYDNRGPRRDFDNRGDAPRTSAPSAPIDSTEEPFVLPGESLAKYRGRPVPELTAAAPVVEPERFEPQVEPEEPQPRVAGQPAPANAPRRSRGGLPSWLLAGASTEGIESAEPNQSIAEDLANEVRGAATSETEQEEEEAALRSASSESEAAPDVDISEEEAKLLSTSVIEAKQDLIRQEVSAASTSGGTIFEEDEEDEEGQSVDERSAAEVEQDEDDEDQLHEENEREHESGPDEDEEHDDEHDGEHQHDVQEIVSSPQAVAEAEADAAHENALHVAALGDHIETDPSHESLDSHETHGEQHVHEGGSASSRVNDNVILLPGETRSRVPGQAPEPLGEFPRQSARVGGNPRSRFQRPFRTGGRDSGGRDRGGRGGRPDRGGSGGERGRGGDRGRGRFERRPGGGSSGGGQHRSGGGRPGYGHSGGHGHSRRPQLISEMLKAGQEVVVQIAKEPLGKKGARITSHVALPGRFLVYMPTIDHIGVSRKIASAENRSRLRRLVGEARGSYPGGFIVRTAAGEATDDEIRADIDFLGKTWLEIKQKHDDRKAPAILHRDLNLVERILRDYVSDDFTAIWIDNEEEFAKVTEFVSRFQPKLVSRVKLYAKEQPIFEEFGIQHELDKALRAKVWLKSGGYIVINHTEALVAIDVNTGKFVGKGSTRLEDTIVKTNLEAVKEIVRQIRLRDLGGIIVVDFIDMEERRNRERVLSALQQALDQDKAPSKALSFNEFGLVCITRKRTKQALERVLCQPCPSCTGSGMVKSIPTLCYEIQNEARKMAAATPDNPNLTLRVHPEIAKALKTRESMLIDELEQNAHKHIIIQSDATLHWEQYDIY